MAFSLEELKQEYTDTFFFTSQRECIEYLLLENLEALEEYALLVTKHRALLFTPHPVGTAKAESVLYEGNSTVRYQDKVANIQKQLEEWELPSKGETAFERQCYADYFSSRGFQIKDCTKQMQIRAQIKTEEQLDAIRDCVRLDEEAYRAVAAARESETELSLFGAVRESMIKHTGFPNAMIYDFLAGQRTGDVSGFPTNYRIQWQDTLIADLLPRHKGVYADMTRTFFAGQPTQKQRYVYEVLCQALQAGEEVIKPGTTAKEVYDSVYHVFLQYGLEENFLHHAGHGLGMGYYEAPYFLKEEEDLLKENMVIALEPGLYFHGEFGIRIENNYVVTKTGARRMDELPLAIENYILNFG